MILVVGQPIAAATERADDWLSACPAPPPSCWASILGLMMGFDMGGPLNKVAYTFAAGGLTTAITTKAGAAGCRSWPRSWLPA